MITLSSYFILECDEEVTVTSCHYTSPALFPSEFKCNLGFSKDSTSFPLEENENSWIEVKFDQAYDLESLKLGQYHYSMPAVVGPSKPLSVVLWIEFSDGKRIFVTVEDDESLEDIILAKLVQTTSIKIGIDSVEGSLMVFVLSELEIFGCSLSK